MVLVGFGVYFVGQQVLTLIDGLQAFVSSARTEADLDQAARHFTSVMVSGVSIARALFTRSKGRGGSHEPSMVLRAKAKGGSGGGKKPGTGQCHLSLAL